jgi:hypothetical protein
MRYIKTLKNVYLIKTGNFITVYFTRFCLRKVSKSCSEYVSNSLLINDTILTSASALICELQLRKHETCNRKNTFFINIKILFSEYSKPQISNSM